MTKYHPARLIGFSSCGFVYCRECASEAFADSGEPLTTAAPGWRALRCCSCGAHLTPAPSLDEVEPGVDALRLPVGGQVIA